MGKVTLRPCVCVCLREGDRESVFDDRLRFSFTWRHLSDIKTRKTQNGLSELVRLVSFPSITQKLSRSLISLPLISSLWGKRDLSGGQTRTPESWASSVIRRQITDMYIYTAD